MCLESKLHVFVLTNLDRRELEKVPGEYKLPVCELLTFDSKEGLPTWIPPNGDALFLTFRAMYSLLSVLNV
jgi:hypothetical protein